MSGRILPSWHAQLRWLQRVDATEEFPASAIREAVESGERRELDLGVEIAVVERHNVSVILREERGVQTAVTVLNSEGVPL